MFKAYAIPALSGIALSASACTGGPNNPDLQCMPENTPVSDTGTYNLETGTVTNPLECPEFEASCCPSEPIPSGADPLAGEWEVGPYPGGFYGCTGVIFRSAAHKGRPQTCVGAAYGTMRLGADLQGCMDLETWANSSSYYPDSIDYCTRYDVSVGATKRADGNYTIKLQTTEDSLNLDCMLSGIRLDCTDSKGNDWNFRRL